RWWGSLPRGGYGEVSDDRRTPHARAGSPRVPPSGREGLRGDAPARRGLGRLRAGASRASSTASPKVSVGCVNRTAMTARWSICGSLQQYEIYSRCIMKQDRWDRHFLQLCVDHARMSKDPSTRVGAVLVGPELVILASGFNGFPRGVKDTEERLNDRELKTRLVVHAEMNAVLAAARVGVRSEEHTS